MKDLIDALSGALSVVVLFVGIRLLSHYFQLICEAYKEVIEEEREKEMQKRNNNSDHHIVS